LHEKITDYCVNGFSQAFFTINSKFERVVIDRGWKVEKKWRDLSGDLYGKYLDDDHPGSYWFVEFINSKSPIKVLEIGAGSLHEARLLYQGGTSISVDISVVDVARELIAKGRREFPMIKFIEGDINRMELPDDTYNVVYCRHVIEHQPYFKSPIQEMLRVSKDLVIINLFRWSLGEDIIQRKKYYSNSCSIKELLTYLNSLGVVFEYFVVLRGKKLGENAYEDLNIRRTGDHLVIVIKKKGQLTPEEIYRPLDTIDAKFIRRPYEDVVG